MKVILKETIEALGIVGSAVSVANGYARNYLLPQDKAVPDTPQNRKMLEQQKAKFELQIAKEREQAEEDQRQPGPMPGRRRERQTREAGEQRAGRR